MSTSGAILLLFVGMLALLAAWNAVKPVRNPTRRYSPWWLPAMVVTEIAPFWLLVAGLALAAGLLAGGWDNVGGRIGAAMIVVASVLLVVVVLRSRTAVRRLRRQVTGRVHPARGIARLLGRPVPAPPGVVEECDIVWRRGLTLDLVRPTVTPASAPVLVYVHGGAWTRGDPQRQARDLYHSLALGGWVVLAIRYPFTPGVTVEDQIGTVRAAVRWARRGLLARGITAERVAVAGGSAGGHLAAMAALTPRHADERVDACVGIYAIYDMANRTPTRAHWQMIPDDVMLQTVEESPARYRALSPLDRIHDASPPMLVVHGTHDTLVPIAEGEQFVDALRAAGRPVDFVPVHGAQHAFDALSSPTSRTTAAVIRDWLDRPRADRRERGGAEPVV